MFLELFSVCWRIVMLRVSTSCLVIFVVISNWSSVAKLSKKRAVVIIMWLMDT